MNWNPTWLDTFCIVTFALQLIIITTSPPTTLMQYCLFIQMIAWYGLQFFTHKILRERIKQDES